MEEDKRNNILVSDFAQLMYSKGYRGKYTLLHPGTGHPGMMGTLTDCLEKFLTGYRLTEQTKDKLQLDTYADNSLSINCSFKIQFDEVKGFLIREVNVRNVPSEANRLYKITHNQQIPGSVAVQGLFPKPKPWEKHIKGKFRL